MNFVFFIFFKKSEKISFWEEKGEKTSNKEVIFINNFFKTTHPAS